MRKLLILTAVLAALALPAQASALITLGVGMGKIALGMTQAEAEQAQGIAQVVRTQDPITGEPQTIFRWKNFEAWIEGGNTLTRIVTTKRYQRTFLGIGVGTKLAKLKEAYGPVLTCKKTRPVVCTIGRPEVGGSRVTEFTLRSGRIAEITLRVVL